MGKNKKKKVANRSATPAGRRTGERAASAAEEGSSDKQCQHIGEIVKPSKFKKKLDRKTNFSASCEVTKCRSNQEDGVWVCLRCAFRGCGRYSEEQHALKHSTSDKKHMLAVNINIWQVWCYGCDCPADPDSSPDLKMCISELKKRLGGPVQKQQSNHPLPSSAAASRALPPCVKGLANIGNTCFFNSVIQNLNQTILLHHHLKHVAATGWKKIVEVPDGSLEPLEVVVKDGPGNVTSNLQCLLDGMRDPSKKGSLTPRSLFNSLRARVSKFEGYRQQDSHELLRHLLDEMKTEEMMRVKRAILARFNVVPESKESMKKLTEEERERIRCYGRSVNHTFVDKVFGGELVSTVVCKQCRQVSKLVEGFLDLSVPVPSESKYRKSTPGSRNVPPDTNTPSKHQLKKQKEEAKKQQKHDAKVNKKKGTTMNLSQLHTFVDNSTAGKQEVGGANEEVVGANEEVGGANEAVGGANETNGSHIPEKVEEEEEQGVEEEASNQRSSCLPGSDDGGRRSGPAVPTEECADETCHEKSQVQEELCEQVQIMELSSCSTEEQDESSAIAAISTEVKDSTSEEEGQQPAEEIPQPLAVPSAFPAEGELEFCLRQFISTELLTGKDMYACDRCTARKQQQKRRAAQKECSVNESGEPKGKSDTELGTKRPGNGNVKQQSTNHSDPRSDGDDMKEETVFAEAEKWFLVQRLPPVLTLHLKRFEQQGMMRVTKNNRHVTFPLILDMAPYCTHDSEELTDSDGRLLYSLYGVVEHHGNMAGGHYVAYVRVRPSSGVPEEGVDGTPPAKCGRSRSADTEKDGEEEGQASSKMHQSEDTELLAGGEPDEVMVQGEQVQSSVERECEDPTKTQERATISESNSSVENPMRQESGKASEDDKNDEKSLDLKSSEPSQLDQTNDTPNVSQSLSEVDPSSVRMGQEGDKFAEGRRFDQSSADGQWYHISDSQVSAVGKNKVLGSQAFLLFYERLPLVKSTSSS